MDTVDAPLAAVVCCTKLEVVDALTKGEVVDAVATPVADVPSVPVQAAP